MIRQFYIFKPSMPPPLRKPLQIRSITLRYIQLQSAANSIYPILYTKIIFFKGKHIKAVTSRCHMRSIYQQIQLKYLPLLFFYAI